jgi:hypothetical protein
MDLTDPRGHGIACRQAWLSCAQRAFCSGLWLFRRTHGLAGRPQKRHLWVWFVAQKSGSSSFSRLARVRPAELRLVVIGDRVLVAQQGTNGGNILGTYPVNCALGFMYYGCGCEFTATRRQLLGGKDSPTSLSVAASVDPNVALLVASIPFPFGLRLPSRRAAPPVPRRQG